MGDLAHMACVAATALGVWCAALDTRRRMSGVWRVAQSTVMLFAMIDIAGGLSLLPGVLWAAAIIAGELLAALLHRLDSASGRAGDATRRESSGGAALAHRGTGAILMAALIALTSTHIPSTAAATASHHGAGSPALATIVVAASVVYIGFSLCLVVKPRGSSRTGRVEMLSMASGIAIMSGMGAAL